RCGALSGPCPGPDPAALERGAGVQRLRLLVLYRVSSAVRGLRGAALLAQRSVMSRVVLILGATGGVGSALARLLSKDGVQLALAARGRPRLEALASELGASAHPLDATSFDAVDAAVDEVLSTHGTLDGVVNCVGSILLKPAHRTNEA